MRLVGRALALVVSRVSEQEAAADLARAAGHDRRLLGRAGDTCRLSSSGRSDMPEVAQAQQFLEAAATVAAAPATAATAVAATAATAVAVVARSV
ncbi:MAG: hypothetical protein QOI56_651 [Actinomycetota bacterium]|nr:hypothetical protein [Actinomycetota bacterium]